MTTNETLKDLRRFGTKELTREEIRALANAVLDTLGIEDVERSDEEWEALRRAIRERRNEGI